MASERILRIRQEILQDSVNHDACNNCVRQKRCCDTAPCSYAPLDFYDDNDQISAKKIQEKINLGLAAIWFMSLNKLAVASPISKSSGSEIYVNETGGDLPCVFANNCPFSDEDRPFFGASFKAVPNGDCRFYGFEALFARGLTPEDISWVHPKNFAAIHRIADNYIINKIRSHNGIKGND
ncbi:MAG: hypothetical protein LBM09_00445 [Candidatus Nomurabacteria bacterium]|jgi:hypothetical protein|nr:hypothetical protein [Candidatus Nomurabacteria bacterium]